MAGEKSEFGWCWLYGRRCYRRVVCLIGHGESFFISVCCRLAAWRLHCLSCWWWWRVGVQVEGRRDGSGWRLLADTGLAGFVLVTADRLSVKAVGESRMGDHGNSRERMQFSGIWWWIEWLKMAAAASPSQGSTFPPRRHRCTDVRVPEPIPFLIVSGPTESLSSRDLRVKRPRTHRGVMPPRVPPGAFQWSLAVVHLLG